MKIGVIGAPRTGKSVFAKSLSAELSKQGLTCELVPEYAGMYVQQVGPPLQAWEQLVISIGQYLAEQKTTTDHLVTDAAAFVTYIYAQRVVPKVSDPVEWPKYRNLLDILRVLARSSAQSYDLLFLLTHVFPARQEASQSVSFSSIECKHINRDIEAYLTSERIEYHRLKANAAQAIPTALNIIKQRLLIQQPDASAREKVRL
jgi:hypothetical protein